MLNSDVEPQSRFRREGRLVTAVALAVFWLVVTNWRPWDLFARAGFTSDFYDAQAHAFWHGRLAVDPDVVSIEGFLIHGKTYLYYGPFLAFARLPFTLGTNAFDGRLTRVSMLMALAVLLVWSRRLLERTLVVARPSPADRVGSGRRRALLFLCAVAFSPVLYCAGWTSVYHETELWACALSVVSVVLIVDFVNQPSRRNVLLASAGVLATSLTRVTLGLGIAGALVVACLVVRRRRSSTWRIGVGGAIAAVASSAAFNFGKFGTLFGFPFEKQVLSLITPTRAAWFAGNHNSFTSVRFLKTTLAQYLRPDTVRFERLVPFVRFGPRATEFGSYPLESNTPTVSITAAATLLCILAAVGVVWMISRRLWMWAAMTVSMCAAAVAVFLLGFTASRYLVDMLGPLIVAGAIGVWVIPTRSRRTLFSVVAVTLAVWGLWVNVALATWTQSSLQPGFTGLRYAVDRTVFDGASPALLNGVPAVVPRDGVVAVDRDCNGVYIAADSHWFVLERRQGVRRFTGTVRLPAEGQSIVVALYDEAWQLTLRITSNEQVVQVRGIDGSLLAEATVRGRSAEVKVEIVLDPVTNDFHANVGAAFVFLPGVVDAGSLETPGLVRAADPGAPLCRDLMRSL